MDIYKEYIRPKADNKNLVFTGRVTAFVALVVAALVAPQLETLSQIFLFVQEFTGFVSPAIFALFFFGLFWKKATTRAVIWASIISVPASAAFYFLLPNLAFLDRILIVFAIISAIIIGLSLTDKNAKEHEVGVSFKTGKVFNILSLLLLLLLIAIYIYLH